MIQTIRTALRRSDSRLLEDMLGAVALVVMLVAGLHVPVF